MLAVNMPHGSYTYATVQLFQCCTCKVCDSANDTTCVQVFKEEEEAVKVELHEGCGRIKLYWTMALADFRTLKGMVEFREAGGGEENCTDRNRYSVSPSLMVVVTLQMQ